MTRLQGKKSTGYERRADATLSQASPTANTLYTILDTALNVRILSAAVSVTWTVQPDPLEIVLTIDGQTITYSFANPVSATYYVLAQGTVSSGAAPTAQILLATLTATALFMPPFYARSIKIQGRTGKTTAGTVSNLSGRIKYEQLP